MENGNNNILPQRLVNLSLQKSFGQGGGGSAMARITEESPTQPGNHAEEALADIGEAIGSVVAGRVGDYGVKINLLQF